MNYLRNPLYSDIYHLIKRTIERTNMSSSSTAIDYNAHAHYHSATHSNGQPTQESLMRLQIIATANAQMQQSADCFFQNSPQSPPCGCFGCYTNKQMGYQMLDCQFKSSQHHRQGEGWEM